MHKRKFNFQSLIAMATQTISLDPYHCVEFFSLYLTHILNNLKIIVIFIHQHRWYNYWLPFSCDIPFIQRFANGGSYIFYIYIFFSFFLIHRWYDEWILVASAFSANNFIIHRRVSILHRSNFVLHFFFVFISTNVGVVYLHLC